MQKKTSSNISTSSGLTSFPGFPLLSLDLPPLPLHNIDGMLSPRQQFLQLNNGKIPFFLAEMRDHTQRRIQRMAPGGIHCSSNFAEYQTKRQNVCVEDLLAGRLRFCSFTHLRNDLP